MNPKTAFLSALLAAIVAAAVAVALGRSRVQQDSARAESERLEQQVARLGEQNERLAREIESLRSAAAAPGAPAARLSQEEIEAAVARWMERNRPAAAFPDGGAAAPATRAAEASTSAEKTLTVEGASKLLLQPGLDDEEKQKIWTRLREQGLLDETVAWFEERAKADPNDPQKQVELGEAYVQKIFEAGNTPEAGTWAVKADKTWDRALELDPRNWDARFSKAIGLSFWPPIFGKQPEAIRQFETLLEQQEAGGLKPEYAQTYLLLGNLYLQSGAAEKANAVWQKGFSLFPGNADLRARLAAK